MNTYLDKDAVVVEGDARQQLYDSGGYGRPHSSGNKVDLSLVETAHLLLKDKLDSVEGMGFSGLLQYASGFFERFLPTLVVYSDLRERGYYLQHKSTETAVDLYPRGVKPMDGEPERRVEVVTEYMDVDLTEIQGLLGVVDDALDVTYLLFEEWSVDGDVQEPIGEYDAVELGGCAVLHDKTLYRKSFYGSILDEALILSPPEAAYLIECGVLNGFSDSNIIEMNDEVYTELRNKGLCPRSGLKFGTTYRVYDEFTGIDDLGHAPYLVDKAGEVIDVRRIAHSVRLAHGVRKKMVFAAGGRYVLVERHRP